MSKFEQRTLTESREAQEYFNEPNIWLDSGCTLTVEEGAMVQSCVTFRGECQIGANCKIEKGSTLENVKIGKMTLVRPYSLISQVIAGDDNIFGPFCFIRDNTLVENDCVIGANTEVTRSNIATGVKISHKAFVGDADIGNRVVIGAGVVFCNWDGKARQVVKVGDEVIIGSLTAIVAPLVIGSKSIIGAGSVLTKNVGEHEKIIQKIK